MLKRNIQKVKQTSLILPKEVVDQLDALSSQTELNRSEVVTSLLTHDLEKQEVLDEVFGPENPLENVRRGGDG